MSKIARPLLFLLLFISHGLSAGQKENTISRLIENQKLERENEIKNILVGLFPEDEAIIRKKLRVDVFSKEEKPWAYSPVYIEKEIKGAEGYFLLNIRFDVFSRLEYGLEYDEFVAVMAHEWAHVKLKHVPVFVLITADGVVGAAPRSYKLVEDLELVEKQEFAADEFAVNILIAKGYGRCVFAGALYKFFKRSGATLDESPNDPLAEIDRKRVLAVINECASVIF